MRVHHVGYLVKRIERAEEIFSTLGYGRVTQTVLDPIRNVDISFWEKDGYVIELVCPKSEDSVVAGLIKKYKNTPYHICYESDDLESDMELLKRVGGFVEMDELTPAPAIAEDAKAKFLYSSQIGIVELMTRG